MHGPKPRPPAIPRPQPGPHRHPSRMASCAGSRRPSRRRRARPFRIANSSPRWRNCSPGGRGNSTLSCRRIGPRRTGPRRRPSSHQRVRRTHRGRPTRRTNLAGRPRRRHRPCPPGPPAHHPRLLLRHHRRTTTIAATEVQGRTLRSTSATSRRAASASVHAARASDAAGAADATGGAALHGPLPRRRRRAPHGPLPRRRRERPTDRCGGEPRRGVASRP